MKICFKWKPKYSCCIIQIAFEENIQRKVERETSEYPDVETECVAPSLCHEFQTARLLLSHFGFLSLDALQVSYFLDTLLLLSVFWHIGQLAYIELSRCSAVGGLHAELTSSGDTLSVLIPIDCEFKLKVVLMLTGFFQKEGLVSSNTLYAILSNNCWVILTYFAIIKLW